MVYDHHAIRRRDTSRGTQIWITFVKRRYFPDGTATNHREGTYYKASDNRAGRPGQWQEETRSDLTPLKPLEQDFRMKTNHLDSRCCHYPYSLISVKSLLEQRYEIQSQSGL